MIQKLQTTSLLKSSISYSTVTLNLQKLVSYLEYCFVLMHCINDIKQSLMILYQLNNIINNKFIQIQINQNEILLSLAPAIQEEIQMELRMPNKTTVTKILAQQQNVQIAFQRKATPQNRKQDNQFMTLFPGLNLDQIRNNANTITRNSLFNQKLLSTKRSNTSDLIPVQYNFNASPKYLQNKLHQSESQRRVCEEV
ncbi:Hypothetical_protein [Hexamita inflata]|uniref:Hypothetical_protein n=1 Tax=Hexamita inflata TaxID=28002 RepID=A0AA86V2S4_9EUKA|nr:Hypothetical protein HINF_LOCUS66089 [Hexamita inflata]